MSTVYTNETNLSFCCGSAALGPFVCSVVKWNQHTLINDESYWVSAEEEAR